MSLFKYVSDIIFVPRPFDQHWRFSHFPTLLPCIIYNYFDLAVSEVQVNDYILRTN